MLSVCLFTAWIICLSLSLCTRSNWTCKKRMWRKSQSSHSVCCNEWLSIVPNVPDAPVLKLRRVLSELGSFYWCRPMLRASFDLNCVRRYWYDEVLDHPGCLKYNLEIKRENDQFPQIFIFSSGNSDLMTYSMLFHSLKLTLFPPTGKWHGCQHLDG